MSDCTRHFSLCVWLKRQLPAFTLSSRSSLFEQTINVSEEDRFERKSFIENQTEEVLI